MMENVLLKRGFAIGLLLALIAGCSSTSQTSGAGDADSSGAGGAAGGSGAVVDSADDWGGVQSGDLGAAGAAGAAGSATGSLDYIYYFDFDTSELSMDVRARLDETASVMRTRSGLIRLEGHADERGTREYNLALGERRAKAVANYLAIQGVPHSQIEVISYGEEKPAIFGQGETAWAKNRRVELIYVD